MKEVQPQQPQSVSPDMQEGGATMAPPVFQLKASNLATPPEDEGGPLQFSRGAGGSGAASPPAPPTVGGGQEMDPALRQHMEGALGASFAGVKIEKDSAEADKMGALAMTDGETIKFAKGQYNPNSSEGKALIGHELGHIKERQTTTIAATGVENGVAVNTDSRSEQFADQMGARAAAFAGAGQLMAEVGQLSAGPIQMAENPNTPRLDGYVGRRMNQQGAISSPGDDYQTVKSAGVRVRAKPDGGLPTISRIVFGTRVHILGADTTDAFYFVSSHDGKTGWVNRSYVATGMPDPLATIHHITEPNLTTILQQQYVDKGHWTLSSGNDYTSLAMAIHVANGGKGGIRIDMAKYQQYKKEHPIINAFDPTIENRAIYHAAEIIKGTNVWLPSVAYIRAMQDGGAVATRPGWMNTAVEIGNGIAGFGAGIIAGVAGNIWDTLTGLWDLGTGIVSTIRGLLDGSLFSSLSEIYDTLKNMTVETAQSMVMAIVSSIGDGIKDFVKSWTQADVFKKWYFRGQIIGNIALEIVLAIFTGGSTLGAKVLAKVGQYFPKLAKVLGKLVKAADKLDFGRGRKGSDGKALTRQIDGDVDMDDSPTRDWYQTLAMARLITESHDAKNTPVDVLIPLLNKTLGAKSKAVKGYKKQSLGKPGHYKIIQFAKKKRPQTSEVDANYTEQNDQATPQRPNVDDAKWYNHNNKHKRAKSEKEAKKMSENGGNAQYLPDVDNQALELEGLKKGIVYDRGSMYYFFYKSPKVIGYDEGVPTQWIRAELSSGTYHGHPMNEKRLSKYIKVP